MAAIVNNGRSYGPATDIDDDEIDLGDLLGVLIGSRWLILGIMLVVFALGALYGFVATPIYKADGLIQVEEKQSGFGDFDINALFEGDTSVNAEIEILRSRLVLGAVV
ncbi:MAG: tyrosine-protein kinase, partial [Acidobacteria bacterium]|nr:tyrosine-protein kinase [Acidobacteriota bacterium]